MAKAWRAWGVAGVVALAMVGCATGQGQLRPFAQPAADGRELSEVKLRFNSPQQLGAAVDQAGLDLYGADMDRQEAQGAVSPEGLATLRRLGLQVEVVPMAQAMANRNGFDKGHRTYEVVAAQLQELAARYPKLTRLDDMGPSWETTQGKANRQLWAMRITGPGDASKRPAVAFTANIHARELAPVEMAMSLIELLLQRYDQDPKIKALVDSRVIHIAPMMNPDGHVHAEKGENWRKNTHPFQGGVGVDLNRNFPFKWELGDNSTPAQDTYRGPAPASEPETQAILKYLSNIPNLKVGMDYHSYSNLVMWSWGYTSQKPPDAAVLEAIGKKLASFNKYRPIQACELYPTSGTIRDTVYGTLKVPYFTTEMGSSMDGFAPSFKRTQQLVAENQPGALFLIELADQPAKILSR
jgi:carboxypeptidase T